MVSVVLHKRPFVSATLTLHGLAYTFVIRFLSRMQTKLPIMGPLPFGKGGLRGRLKGGLKGGLRGGLRVKGQRQSP